MPEKTADLHLHTTFSDGTDSPAQVVELIKQKRIDTIAITDHDNTEAFAIAQPLAEQHGIELITGIEMSASADDHEIHILGFLFDLAHPGLVQYLAIQQARRVERLKEMVSRLQAIGVKIDADEVLELGGQGTVGRPHVARILLKHGYISSLPEAFTKYIGTKNPGFVPGSPTPPAEVIRVIRDAGGIPVLAHPVYLEDDPFIEQLVKEGIVGLEVFHSKHTPNQVRKYNKIADRLKLLKTGGSDYHGTPKEGVPVGGRTIPYSLVEALKQWKASTR